jgi:hypothetical protein
MTIRLLRVLWRRQQHHVDNMLVVGAGSAIVAARLGDQVDRIWVIALGRVAVRMSVRMLRSVSKEQIIARGAVKGVP